MSTIRKGVVKWFNNAKGFGFIEHESGKDVFVHYSVIEDDGYKSLKDGEEVEYEIKEGPKGFHAIRVVRSPKAVSLESGVETVAVDEASAENTGTDASEAAVGSAAESDSDASGTAIN